LRIFATNGTRIVDESARLAAAQQIYAGWALFGMKFSTDSLLDRKGSSTTAPLRLLRATKAGALYAIIVFVIGFILGTIRVLLLAPRLGETTAVILEAPIMVAASWFVCRWCVGRLDVRRTVPARFLMGLVAFLVLTSAEVSLGALLGRSIADQLATYGSLAGAIGLAAQMIFAIFPVIQVWQFGKPLDRQNTAAL
jgi:hypothetical protein